MKRKRRTNNGIIYRNETNRSNSHFYSQFFEDHSQNDYSFAQ